MPVMDGIKLSNEIRKTYAREELAIIGISGTSNGTHSARFIKNGADDFLRKPFCLEEFYCRITQNIESLTNIQKIQHVANTDYLTEIPNRRAFYLLADKQIPDYIQNNIPYCIAVLDIDYFKKINDNYGHDVGDHVLKVFALYMKKHFGSGMISRLGGEEFSVLLKGDDIEYLYNKLDAFRVTIEGAPITYNGEHIKYTVSIGVIFNSKKNLEQQIREADLALYKAKANGRNQISIYRSPKSNDSK